MESKRRDGLVAPSTRITSDVLHSGSVQWETGKGKREETNNRRPRRSSTKRGRLRQTAHPPSATSLSLLCSRLTLQPKVAQRGHVHGVVRVAGFHGLAHSNRRRVRVTGHVHRGQWRVRVLQRPQVSALATDCAHGTQQRARKSAPHQRTFVEESAPRPHSQPVPNHHTSPHGGRTCCEKRASFSRFGTIGGIRRRQIGAANDTCKHVPGTTADHSPSAPPRESPPCPAALHPRCNPPR